MTDSNFVVLGGAGMVGFQIAYRIATELNPRRIVLVGLREVEVDEATEALRELAPGVEIVGEWGDILACNEFSRRPRSELLADPDTREAIFADLLGPFEPAYERSRLAHLIRTHRPDVVVDSINTATAISYQDVYTTAVLAKRDVDTLQGGGEVAVEDLAGHVESLILSLSVPQLIRHVRTLHQALVEVGTRLYLKVGTTGTGGMGLNIPYTHSEDRPSAKLMTKAAVGFAHTGLLFLMARTAGGPAVKEVKPAALIGYADIAHRVVSERGEPVGRFRARREDLASTLRLHLPPEEFTRQGDVALPVVNTGENGVFTRGEFEAITSLGQMEFVTPEEIAHLCVAEIRGANTGRDVIAAMDGAIIGPSYRGGILRARALDELRRLEAETGTHSVALGQLGPPELSKLLWEAELLSLVAGTVVNVVETDPDALAADLEELLGFRSDLVDTITSLGLPILSTDGSSILRGPFIRIPEVPGDREVEMSPEDRDRWAEKGWVDLRPSNVRRWQARFKAMRDARLGKAQRGSAGVTLASYLPEHIEVGTVAAWVLANEHGGYRIK